MPPPGADPWADIAQQPAPATSPDPWAGMALAPSAPSTPDPSAAAQAVINAKALAYAPLAGLNEGGAVLQQQAGKVVEAALPTWGGLRAKVAGAIEPKTQADLDAARAYTEAKTGANPLARSVAGVATGVTPFLAGPVVGATSMGMQAQQQALDAGADPWRALASGAIGSATGAALAPVGRAVAPLADAAAAPVARAAGALPAALVKGAVEGAPQGAVMGAGDVAATAVYDPQAALERAKALPDTIASMGILSALTHGAPAAGRAVLGAPDAVRALRAGPAPAAPGIAPDAPTVADLAPITEADAPPAWVKPPGWDPQFGSPKHIEAPGDILNREDTPGDIQALSADLEKRTPVARALMEKRRAELSGEPDPNATAVDLKAIPSEDPYLAGTSPDGIPQTVKALHQPAPETPTLSTMEVGTPESRAGAAELARMEQEAAKAKAISEQAKVEALQQETNRRAQFYRDNQPAMADWARKFLNGEAKHEDAPSPDKTTITPPSSDTQAPPFEGPRLRPDQTGRAVESAPAGATPEAAPSPKPAEPIAPAKPRPFLPGDRVRMAFKGRDVPATIVNRVPNGRFRVKAEDGRTFPAVDPTRIAHREATDETPGALPDSSVRAPARVAGDRGPSAPPAAPRSVQPAAPAAMEPGKGAKPSAAPASPPRLTSDALRAQFDALPIAKRTPGFTETHLHLLDARARSSGETLDSYIGRSIAGVKSEATPGRVSLNQGESVLDQGDRFNDATTVKRAMVRFLGDNRAIIHAFEHANESSVLHELGHVFRRDLSGEDLAATEHWAGVKQGNWTRGAEEKFARAFEQYLRDGQAPTPALKPTFLKFFQWLHNVYHSLRGSPIDVPISPAVRRVFDRLLTPDAMKRVEADRDAETAPAPAAEPAVVPHEPEPVGREPDARMAPAPAKPEAPATDAARVGAPNQRPDLATPGIDPEARKATIEARNQIPEVEKRSREDIRAAAQKRVDADPEGTLKRLTDMGAKGKAWSAVDMASAQALLDKLGKDPARAGEHARLVLAYQLAGNEGAVAMGMRVDRLQSPEGRLAEARDLVALPVAAVSRKLEVLRAQLRNLNTRLDTLHQADPTERQLRAQAKKLEDAIARMEAQTAKRTAADKAHLKSLGFDLDDPNPAWAQDRERFKQFIGALDATKGGMPAVLREFYVGALHMSGMVFGKKVIADSISLPTALIRRHLEAAVAGGKRLIGKGSDSEASLGELAAMWRAVGPAFVKARANGAAALLTESFPKELQAPEDTYHYPAMRGVTGKVLRHLGLLPTVRAIDAFTRSLVAHVEVAGQAYRSGVDGTGKRLEGDALDQHMAREVDDVGSASWDAARHEAMKATFTEEPIAPVRELNRLKYQKANTVWGKTKKVAANALLPFSTLPSNIATQGLADWTPGLADAIAVIKALRRDPVTKEWAYDGNRFNRDVAQAALRWGSLAGFAALANAGVVTGADDRENPRSFNLFGHHFSYRYLGPIARVISSAADWFGPHDEKKEGNAAERVAGGAIAKRWDNGHIEAGDFAEMPMLRLGIDVLNAAHDANGWSKFAADKTPLPIPSIVHQVTAAEQDAVNKRTKIGKGESFGSAYLDFLKDRLTGNGGKAVRVNGRPLIKDSFDSPLGTLLWRVLSPMPMGAKEAPKP